MKLFPQRKPYKKGYFEVDGHKLFYQLYGNPKGKPVLVVHGGPGGGCQPKDARYFDPKKFNILLIDQRGAGKSKPFASLKRNKTKYLVDDLHKFLQFLGIKKVYLFGGSWGSCLSLCYAIKYPKTVRGMVLRGVYLGTKEENHHFLTGGVRSYFPEVWERFISHVPKAFKKNPAKFYWKKMNANHNSTALKWCREWSLYELSALSLKYDQKKALKKTKGKWIIPFARLEAHYLMNNCFLPPNYIIKNAKKIKHIPCTMIQGRYDVICPPTTAYALHKALPKSKLYFVTAGHSSSDPEIKSALVREMKKIAR